MKLDWRTRKGSTDWVAPFPVLAHASGDRLLLHGKRLQDDGNIVFVADVDGPIQVAVREQDTTRCILNNTSADRDHYALRVFDREAQGKVSSYGGGAIGGGLTDLVPKVFVRADDALPRAFAAGEPGISELVGGALRLYPWDGGPAETIAAPEALQLAWPHFVGDALVWQASSGSVRQLGVWTRASGRADFLASEMTRGVGDLGGDGTDWVWFEGTPPANGLEPYSSFDLLTTKFTPGVPQGKTSVRSDLVVSGLGAEPLVVGCGYASRTLLKSDGSASVATIVRLSDGAMHEFVNDKAPPVRWRWNMVMGISCQEAFVAVQEAVPGATSGLRVNVARVRLDALSWTPR